MKFIFIALGCLVCSSSWSAFKVDNCTIGQNESLIQLIPVSRLSGNCVVGNERFSFHDEVFAIHKETPIGRSIRYCQKANYTTPQGKSCDRIVYRIKWKNPHPPKECGGIPKHAEQPVYRNCPN